MKYFYSSILLIFAIIAESSLGYYELIIPLLAIISSYIVCLFTWRKTSILIFTISMSLDIIYARTFLITPFLLLLTVWSAHIWDKTFRIKNVSSKMLLGVMITLLYCSPLYILKIISTTFSFSILSKNLFLFLFFVILTGAIYPVIMNILDKITKLIGLNAYILARDNQYRNKF